MKQFFKILKFELKNYFTNKIFVGTTLFLVFAIIVGMFFPRIIKGNNNEGQEIATNETDGSPVDSSADLPTMLVVNNSTGDKALLENELLSTFFDYKVVFVNDSVDQIKSRITSGEAKCAFVINSLTSYTYYVDNLSLTDNNTSEVDTILQNMYLINAMAEKGMTIEEAKNIIAMPIENKVENLGKNQVQNFFYTYVMIFALYMAILLYGQMIAMNVATEKSSRAMELLITSAKPVSMMFGKVIASCIAGLIQLITIFGSVIIGFNLNKDYFGEASAIYSIFDIPVNIFIYIVIFFILGFFIYGFMFGAVGSMASKVEDINSSSMPITMIFVFAFIVVMFSMSSGNVDSVLMRVCSFIPFTSPMAMFTRLAMSTVPMYEVIISIAILVFSVVIVGYMAAKIYRVGVLLYGTSPKFMSIIKAIKKS